MQMRLFVSLLFILFHYDYFYIVLTKLFYVKRVTTYIILINLIT